MRKINTGNKAYIVRGEKTRRYKIGRSLDPKSRLRELQSGSPDVLELVATIPHDAEERLHAMFASSRHHGEWFDETPELLALVAEYSAPLSARIMPSEPLPKTMFRVF